MSQLLITGDRYHNIMDRMRGKASNLFLYQNLETEKGNAN